MSIAIDRPVGSEPGPLLTDEGRQGRVPVEDGDDLLGDHTGGDFARPADHGGCAVRAFPTAPEAPFPVAAGSKRLSFGGTTAVVTGPDDDRVVADAEFVEGVQDLTGAMIELARFFGAACGLLVASSKSGCAMAGGWMLVKPDVGVEGFANPRWQRADEVDRLIGDLLIH